MKIVIRADASVKIGTGHVMRCLTLANELKKNGANITFIIRAHKGNLSKLISNRGFEVIELPEVEFLKSTTKVTQGDNYEEWLGVSQEKDARETIKTLSHKQQDWLIVDHYALDEMWEKIVRPYVDKILVIDDLANRHHDCDILLDQNWFKDKNNRYVGLVPTSCTMLLGPEYALLRSEFAQERKKLRPRNGKVDRIFVFFGGSDPYYLTGMTLHALSKPQLAHLHVDVVIGAINTHRVEIQRLVESRHHTNLYIQIENIASIMAKADLALGSGGSNNWERCCLGLPGLITIIAENQRLSSKELVKKSAVIFFERANYISNLIKYLCSAEISKWAKKAEIASKKLCDGLGTTRVTRMILKI